MIPSFGTRPALGYFEREIFSFGEGAALRPYLREKVHSLTRDMTENGVVDGSAWSGFDVLHKDLLDRIRADDPQGYEEIERRLYASALTHGFMQGHFVAGEIGAHELNWRHCGSMFLDHFYRLAEAVGAMTVSSVEHGQTIIGESDLDGVFDRIQACVGADLTPPKMNGGLFGIRLRQGIIDDRHCAAIYAAWRLKNICASTSGADRFRVLEFGGGAGHAAYYARRMGATRYSIVDLPVTRLVQFVVLGEEFAEDVAIGPGKRAPINLIGPEDISRDGAGDFDIAFSMDSLPEFPRAAAKDYMGIAEKIGRLLSINQESAVPNGPDRQNVVADLAKEAGFPRLYRFPAWLRNGYLEEYFAAAGE